MHHRRPIHITLLLAGLILLAIPRSPTDAQTGPVTRAAGADVVINFEPGSGGLKLINPNGLTVRTAVEQPPQGRYLQLEPNTDEPGRAHVTLGLPDGADLSCRGRFTAALRAPSETAPVTVTFLALDAKQHPIFQRRVTFEPGERWSRVDWPLRNWHWDTRRVGDWDDVHGLAVRIDSADVDRVDVDDLAFTGTESVSERAEWLAKIAFGDRPREMILDQDLLVATDAVEAFDDADLRRLWDDMRRVRTFVRRVFGDAVRPTDDHAAPTALVIFEDRQHYQAFYERLGSEWGVTIRPPTSEGYTIQDISASTYDAEKGTRRPVYLHEAVHTIVARDLRLLTANPSHSPLHEGLATYVQLIVHPDAMNNRAAFARNFEQPIDPEGKGFFQPLEMLFRKRPTTGEYAQLASIVAYLVENDPELLRALAKGLADGSTAADVLARRGPTWNELQQRWLAWGRENVRADADSDNPLFNPPQEFR